MTQRPLFAKATTFRRPVRTVNRWGDPIRLWWLTDKSGKVCEMTQICGVKTTRTFKAIVLNEHGEYLISRHRRLRPAQAALVRAVEPQTPKRRKVRR